MSYANVCFIITKSRWQNGVPGPILAIRSYHPSYQVALLDCNQCLHRADVFAGHSQHWRVYKKMSPISSSLLPQQCLVRLTWIVCEIGGRWPTAAVLWAVASRICSRQYAAFFCSSYLAFSIRLFSVHVVHPHNLKEIPFYFIGEMRFPYYR